MDGPAQDIAELEPERAPLSPGASLGAGSYTIARLLGEGGFALTYIAHQGPWKFKVCIKEFFPIGCERHNDGIHPGSAKFSQRMLDGLRAFSDEAAALARFNHPGIVRVLGSFNESNTAYLVQELLEGMTLSDGLAMAGKMKEPVVLKVAQQLGQALLMVHAAGLVHSDLKPENIFLTKEGRYVLLDFGLTRGFLSADSASKGGRGLSLGYAPPEQYAVGQQLTPAADVYGFAATLFTLLTGMAPPDAKARQQGQVLPSMETLNPSVTPPVESALVNALVLDPNMRTPGVREFLHQLSLDSTPKAISYRPPQFELKSTQFAHKTGINVLTLHAATHRLYSGGRDGTIKIWSWPELELLGSRQASEYAITALAVSRKGTLLVSGSGSGAIRLWNTDFAEEGHLLSEENTATNRLKFSPTSGLIAASFADGKCCLMGPTLPEPIRWIAHAGSANSLDFHPSGSFLLTAGDDMAIRFWDFPEPQMFCELKGHEKSIQSAVLSPDGSSLLTSSNDNSVKFWDLTTNQVVRDLKSHHAVVFEACYTCHENVVVSISGDHCLRAFRLGSSRIALLSEVHNERTRAIAVDPAQPLVALATGEGEIQIWNFPESF